MMDLQPEQVDILVVDDTPANLVAIRHLLDDMDINLVMANSGYEALSLTLKHNFALVLLDVQMPELDGYQTAEMMQSAEHSQHIPIIFVTALSLDDTDMLKGYRCGAVDYIRKPVQSAVLRSKVTIFKALFQQRSKLDRLNKEKAQMLENLEERVDLRTVELRQTVSSLEALMAKHKAMQAQMVRQETMAELGNLVAGVAHEVNTPVGVSVTTASHLRDKTEEILQLAHSAQMKKSQLMSYLAMADQSSQLLLTNLHRAANLVKSFKRIAVDQSSHKRRTFSMKECIEDVIASLGSRLKKSSHPITLNCPETFLLTSLPGLYAQIFTNLIMNSLIHGFAEMEQGEITITVTPHKEHFEISYQDNGAGMPEEDLEQLFKPFFTTRREQGGSGLGASVIFNSVNELGGEISVESQPGEGTTFLLTMLLEHQADSVENGESAR